METEVSRQYKYTCCNLIGSSNVNPETCPVCGRKDPILEEIDNNNTKFNWEETLKFPIYLGGFIGEFFGAPVLKLIWRKNLKNLKEIF